MKNLSRKFHLVNTGQKAMFPIASQQDAIFGFTRPFCVPEKSAEMI